MARNKGTFSYAANYEVKIQALLDPRGGVDTKEELINKETFPYDGDTIYMKEGMLVTVSSTQEVYMLVSLANILATDYSGWKRVDAGAVTPVEIVDNLTSDATDKALSAKQGKELKSEIDGVKAKVTSIYTPKGSVDSYDKLPTENLTAGDVYNVVAAYGNYPAGTNWAWTGTEWDALAGSIDLSSYYTISQVNELVLQEKIRAEAKELIKELKQLGKKVIMFSGDQKSVAETVAKELNLDEVHAELLPDGKVIELAKLIQNGSRVAFV
jgi:hypothetical protein